MFVYTIGDIVGLVVLGVFLLILIIFALTVIVQGFGEHLLGRATRRDTEPVEPVIPFEKVEQLFPEMKGDPSDTPEIIRSGDHTFKVLDQPNIPFLMHKEMDIPLSECKKAYDVAIDYLRSQGKLRG